MLTLLLLFSCTL